MRLKYTAVDSTIMPSKHSYQFSCENRINSNGTSIWNKGKLWITATRDGKFESFPTFITDFPIVHLQNKRSCRLLNQLLSKPTGNYMRRSILLNV